MGTHGRGVAKAVIPLTVARTIEAWIADRSDPLTPLAKYARLVAYVATCLPPHHRGVLNGYPWSVILREALETDDTATMARAARLVAGRMTPAARKDRAKRAAQASAGKRTIRISYNGETRTVAQWAARLGISATALHRRLKAGWPIKEALERERSDPASRQSVAPREGM
jgi:hypothetical protein